MDIETIVKESQAEKLLETFEFQTEVGKKQFSKQLRLFTSSIPLLCRRQQGIENLRRSLTSSVKEDLNSVFKRVASLEPQCSLFFQKSDVEKNSYEQLTFSGWVWAQILNTIPFVLLLLSYFKLYVVPGLALLTPLFMVAMPYFILIYWYNLPLNFSQYRDLMLGMMGIQSQNFWTPKNLLQVGITGFSIVQNMVQPVQNAIHLKTIDTELVKRGQYIEEIASLIDKINQYFPIKNPLQEILDRQSDPHRTFGETWDLPFRLQYALDLLGEAEVTFRVAASTTKKALYSTTQGISLQNAYDPLLPNSIPFSVQCTKKNHSILTGPNRGGKSSFLRATLLNVVFAQTFGFVFAEKAVIRPVDWIATGLRLEDRPGKSSMFEREVEFAVTILNKSKQSNEVGLVLFDELFHSTNPPDGTRTAKLFLDQVWKQPNIVSIISTHVFEIARTAPTTVKRLCVPAFQTEDGELQFTYRLQSGICEVSSVDCILKEKGLLRVF